MTALVARAVAGIALMAVGAGMLWPAGLGALPAWALIPGALRVALLLLALALFFMTARDPLPARRLAIAGALLGGIALLSWMVTSAVGTAAALAKIGATGTLAKWLALRPTAPVSLGMVALGASIASRRPDGERFDLSALLGSIAACIFFLVCVGHLYGAREIIAPALGAASTGLTAALLLAISLAALALHSKGPMAAYAGAEPGAVTRRRLLPAAVLTPIASGYVLVYALTGEQLSPTLAVALVVFVNVGVMLILTNRTGNTVARVVWDRQKRAEAREAQIRRQGLRDPMTALLNRRGWEAEVQAGEQQCKSERVNACVLVIDLDGLKQVNDTEGHKAGDAYIHRAAHALRKAARRGEPLARVGGDEFAYLVVGCDEVHAHSVVIRFQESLRASRVSASVGYAMRDGRTIAAAFDEADQAMYRQKRARKMQRA